MSTSASSHARLLREDRDGLCLLTLNRPEKLNALDTEMFDELDAHLALLEQQTDTIGCVILRGNGRGFCAGADLSALGRRADGTPVDARYKPRIIDRLGALPQPVIASVHGACVTGGLELALACDFIIADTSARFADTHGKWGLVGAWGMMQRLPRKIGTQAAKRLMMTGQTFSAQEALTLGLLDSLSLDSTLAEDTEAFARTIMANSWHTNFAIKRTLRATEGMMLGTALAYENFNNPGNASDHAERVARFTKKP